MYGRLSVYLWQYIVIIDSKIVHLFVCIYNLLFLSFSVGYKPFFHAIRGQIQVLSKLVEQTPPTLQLSTTPIESSPISEEQLSPLPQEIRTLDKESPEKDVDKTKEDKPSECTVS